MLQWILDEGDMMIKTGSISHRVGLKAGMFEYGNKFQASPSDSAV